MSSTFRGLETAKSGLTAASINIDVTGQNISNANTAGYTRQRTVTSAKSSNSIYVVEQTYTKMVGQGVSVDGVQQIRSDYLDQQYRDLNSNYNYYEYRAQGMTYLTGVMNELSDNSSVNICLDNFSTALSTLVKDPTSEEYRLNVQQNAATLTKTVNYVYNEMVDLWKGQNESVSTVGQEINSIAEQISTLNQSISSYERTGQKANDLRDSRNLLLDQLAGLVNITYSTNTTDGSMVDVQIGGENLVTGNTFESIQVGTSADVNTYTGLNYYTLSLNGTALETTGSNPLITSGELYGHMELVNNDTSKDAGIPYYISQLNSFAQQVAKAVNDIHSTGYTYPDGTNVSKTGVNFFQVDAGDYSKITGGNFSVSDEVLASVWNIAASSAQIDLSAESTNAGNVDVLQKIYSLANGDTFYSPLNTMVGHLAIAAKTTKGLLDTSESLVDSVDTQRSALSGVSIDEEASNLIMFKQSYNAASRLLTTIDDMISTLINGTGRVGL